MLAKCSNSKDLTRRQSERQAQRAIIKFCSDMGLPFFHIPNGGRRDTEEARALYFDGVTRGVPDLMLPVAFIHPTSGTAYSGCFIEVKAPDCDEGELSADQVGWRDFLISQGYFVMSGMSGAAPVIDMISLIYRPRPMPAFFVAARTLKPRPKRSA